MSGKKGCRARVIAYYLPQFHPIPENDEWWGKGFTEWTNVGKAKPLFKGHYQPRVPADLGYYDLRLPEVREAQADMAREAGVEGFCYWHYWFSHDKRLLGRVFDEVLQSGRPDFPFCLGWANHSWTNKSWEAGTRKVKEQTLMEMVYNKDEYIKHFYDVLPAFKDKRYMQVDGKPIFVVWDPLAFPDTSEFIELWQKLALENGLRGIYFIGAKQNIDLQDKKSNGFLIFKKNKHTAARHYNAVIDAGFDAVNSKGYERAEYICRTPFDIIFRTIASRCFKLFPISKCDQADINANVFVEEDKWENVYPSIMPGWDRSPRSGKKARIHANATPEVFKKHIQDALKIIEHKKDEHKILFLWSWNEWAEGSYVEPDLKYGHGFLDALHDTILTE